MFDSPNGSLIPNQYFTQTLQTYVLGPPKAPVGFVSCAVSRQAVTACLLLK